MVSNRSFVPDALQGPSLLRRPGCPNHASTVPHFDPASANFRNLTVITTSHLNNERPHLKRKQRRILLSGYKGTGIEKRRTMRMYSTQSSSSKSSDGSGSSSSPPGKRAATQATKTTAKANGRLTWRDSMKSPMKALRYSNQLYRDFINWCKHMWAGMKLLAVCISRPATRVCYSVGECLTGVVIVFYGFIQADVRVSAGIVRRITNGKQISRRERNFIVQTGVDLARLVPFSLFLIIPAAEFALPFALRVLSTICRRTGCTLLSNANKYLYFLFVFCSCSRTCCRPSSKTK